MMSGRAARVSFLLVCLALAALLLAGVIDATATGWLFAASLVVLGLLSRGFR